LTRVVAIVAIAASAALLAAPPAGAAGPVQVGGATTPSVVAISGSSVGAFSFVTDYGVPGTCRSTAITGELYPGTPVVDNAEIGEVRGWTSDACTLTGLNYAVTLRLEPGTAAWRLVVDGTPSTGGVVALELRGVTFELRSTGQVSSGWRSRLSGSLHGTFDPTAQRLSFSAVPGVFPLNVTALTSAGIPTDSTFFGQIYTGDRVQVSGAIALHTGGLGPISY
jgi:hypothetical protein